MSTSLRPRESQHARPPPSPTPGVYPNPSPSSQWGHPAISSSVIPFSSCPQSLPASGSFPMSHPLVLLVTKTPRMASNSAVWALTLREMWKHEKRDIAVRVIQEWLRIIPRNLSWFAGNLCTLWETHLIWSHFHCFFRFFTDALKPQTVVKAGLL